MATFYADSSVLVKRHIVEQGTLWFRQLADPASGNVIITARVSVVEVFSALNRRVREGTLNQAMYVAVAADVEAACAAEYRLIELAPPLSGLARVLLERHPLRAYDAVQLASALSATATLRAAGLPTLTFLSADTRLLDAARAEGLAVYDPQPHS